jgi:hypothetical protein
MNSIARALCCGEAAIAGCTSSANIKATDVIRGIPFAVGQLAGIEIANV